MEMTLRASIAGWSVREVRLSHVATFRTPVYQAQILEEDEMSYENRRKLKLNNSRDEVAAAGNRIVRARFVMVAWGFMRAVMIIAAEVAMLVLIVISGLRMLMHSIAFVDSTKDVSRS
jgi:hypothetical protein